MDRREKIRELQDDLRALDEDIKVLRARIENQTTARNGLRAYLRYLQQSDKGPEQEHSFPGLQIPDLHAPAHSREDEKPPAANGHQRKINVMQEVREAVKEVEGDFTQKQITRMISEKYPDVSVNPAVVANSLKKMVQRGQDIILLEQGAGSAPNVYRKIGEMAVQENGPHGVGTDEGGFYVESDDAEVAL